MEIRCTDGPNGFFRLRLQLKEGAVAKTLLTANGIPYTETGSLVTLPATAYLDKTEELFSSEGLCRKMFTGIARFGKDPSPPQEEPLSHRTTITLQEHQQRVAGWM